MGKKSAKNMRYSQRGMEWKKVRVPMRIVVPPLDVERRKEPRGCGRR